MLLVAAVSAGQLVVARAWTRAGARDADIALSHLLMGIAMAGTLVGSLSTLPNAAWEVIFAVMTAWFAWYLSRETGPGRRALVSGHHAPHLLHSAAMLYMFAALAGPASGGGSAMAAWQPGHRRAADSARPRRWRSVFALLLIAYSVRDVDRKACADGYFHVIGRPFTPGGPALATATAGARRPGCADWASRWRRQHGHEPWCRPRHAPAEVPPAHP